MSFEKDDGKAPSMFPERWRILSGSTLKLIAMVIMIIDHYAYYFVSSSVPVLFTLPSSRVITLYWLLRTIGRSAFPIYAMLLVEGFLYTHDRRRYGFRLLLFAMISDIPWDLLHHGVFFSLSSQNVFYTLFLGLVGMEVLERFRGESKKMSLILLVLAIAACYFGADYGISGICLILVCYLFRELSVLRDVLGIGLLSSHMRAFPAFVLMELYSGKRGFVHGKVLQVLFYAVYPLHLMLFYLIKTGIL